MWSTFVPNPVPLQRGPPNNGPINTCHRLLRERDFATVRYLVDMNKLVRSDWLELDRAGAICDVLIAAEKLLPNGHIDYYGMLGVERFGQVLSSDFKNLMNLLDPRDNHFPCSQEAAQFASQAWSFLSNPEKKVEYDLTISNDVGQDGETAALVVKTETASVGNEGGENGGHGGNGGEAAALVVKTEAESVGNEGGENGGHDGRPTESVGNEGGENGRQGDGFRREQYRRRRRRRMERIRIKRELQRNGGKGGYRGGNGGDRSGSGESGKGGRDDGDIGNIFSGWKDGGGGGGSGFGGECSRNGQTSGGFYSGCGSPSGFSNNGLIVCGQVTEQDKGGDGGYLGKRKGKEIVDETIWRICPLCYKLHQCERPDEKCCSKCNKRGKFPDLEMLMKAFEINRYAAELFFQGLPKLDVSLIPKEPISSHGTDDMVTDGDDGDGDKEVVTMDRTAKVSQVKGRKVKTIKKKIGTTTEESSESPIGQEVRRSIRLKKPNPRYQD